MTDTDVRRFRKALEAKREDLSQFLRRRDGIAIERTAEPVEESQLAAERDLAIWNYDRESRLLWEVRAALDRVSDGTYGVCTQCEGTISLKRLEAVPWASNCVRCQETADRREWLEAVGHDLPPDRMQQAA